MSNPVRQPPTALSDETAQDGLAYTVVVVEPLSGNRRLDPRDSQPHSLDRDQIHNRSALDWLVHAVSRVPVTSITYVGGYHIEKVIETHPDFRFVYQKDRQHQGEVASMLLGLRAPDHVIVVRADCLFLPGFFERLQEKGRTAFAGARRSDGADQQAVAMLIAVEDFAQVTQAARALVADAPLASLNDLQMRLAHASEEADIAQDLAALITDKAAVARTLFKGKAQTLETIAPLAKEATVLDGVRFTVDQWRNDSKAVLDRVSAQFSSGPLVVRSSTVSEDQAAFSGAGAFDSILDVPADDRGRLSAAIADVIGSYARDGRASDANDEVLIQPQAEGLISSGVLFTRDPRNGAPYFIVNTDETGRSDTVTSGGAGEVVTYCALPGYDSSHLPAATQQVLRVGRELTALSNIDRLDIEFGVSGDGRCYLFQMRPLTVISEDVADEDFFGAIDGAQDFLRQHMRPRPGTLGATTVFGTMPDWNPVEMIGDAPKPLTLSLYQTLIGDTIWAEARARIGYRRVTPEALIVSIAGRPYVDVRASLNSFLPAGLDDTVGEMWIDAGIERLKRHPYLHDKIEFAVAATCLAPDWPHHAERMRDAGLSAAAISDFKSLLRDLTQRILDGTVAPIEDLQVSLNTLEERRQAHRTAGSTNIHDAARRIRVMVEDTRTYGVLPFAILARYAFIAIALLRGLRDADVITESEFSRFLVNVPTVAGEFTQDLQAFTEGTLPLADMIARYGHLRPHSYDIQSPNYASNPDFYFNTGGGISDAEAISDRGSSAADVLAPKAAEIETCLKDLGLDIDFATFARFAEQAIAAREQGKFVFMRTLNDILEDIAGIGAELDLRRDQLAFVPIDEFLRMGTGSVNSAQRSYLRRMILFLEKAWRLTAAARLPELIRDPAEVGAFEVMRDRPNFVTRKAVRARPVWLDEETGKVDLDGAIVIIRSADPGYDWIFGHRLAGLITQYGGIGSHMSIRAAEFGLPAAIGCGEALMASFRDAREIEIDGARERINVFP